MAYADKEKLTSLAQGIRDRLLIKDKTEAQALVLSVTYPNCIYWTSDTHNIIVGGQVYGRSNQVSADAPFAYLPADVSSPSADPQFDGNHDTIYIQPIKTGSDAGKIKLWWYVNGAWTSTDTLDLVLPTEAEDITYDLTATPDLGNGDVQSAIEALDGKVEQVKEDVFGDEWVDEIFGRKADWIRINCYLGWNGNIGYSGFSDCYGFKIKAGDTFHFIDRKHSMNPMWIAYTEYKNLTGSAAYNGTMPTMVSDECDPDNISQNARVIDHVQTFSSETKMVIVAIEHNANWYQRITSNRGTPLSIADKTGYKIDTWTDDEIITSTTLAVGSVVPYWLDGTRYGGRGVRLNVKEGDKVLLDTYSPALFGLIFTDENRVVKALYDDRRFDGVWTAPVNGYCYIQDVLYRENYHYASAHGHLAYMAHDARKRVAKGGDWYNEYAPRLFNEFFPYTDTFTANGPTRNTDFPIVNNSAALLCYSNRKFQLHMAKLRYANGSPMVSDGSYIHLRMNGSDTGSIINDRAYPADMPDGKSTWIYAIVNTTLNSFASTFLRPYIIGLTKGTTYSIVWEKVFVHTSSDFGELYKLAQKIINGEVEVDNFYGVREKEVDFVKNAIGLQSISDLGYNILEHGATLPIDEEGYKYAKGIYERYKDNPPSGDSWAASKSPFYNNKNVVYVPSIDFSHFAKTGSDYLKQAFINCTNLVCIDDIQLPSDAQSTYINYLQNMVSGCVSLKYVGNIATPPNKVLGWSAFAEGCYALEYVGRITGGKPNGFSLVFKNCYSLKRIEELPFEGMTNPANNDGFLNCINLEYLLCKDFGKSSTMTAFGVFQRLGKWGINSEENPDARQSLVDSLLTYSYDRVNDPDNLGTAGTTCTITLSANSYAQLTASEIEQITAKGYTLTHP